MTPLAQLYQSHVLRRESEVRDHPDRHVRKQAIQVRLQAEAEAEVVWALVMGEMKPGGSLID